MTERNKFLITLAMMVTVVILVVFVMEQFFPRSFAVEERAPNTKEINTFNINPGVPYGNVSVYKIEIEGYTYYYANGNNRSGLAPTPDTIRRSISQPPTE